MIDAELASRLEAIERRTELGITQNRQILEQTTKTNGRVTRIEADLYGDKSHGTPSIKAAVERLETVAIGEAAIRTAIRWALPLLVSTLLAILAVLVTVLTSR